MPIIQTSRERCQPSTKYPGEISRPHCLIKYLATDLLHTIFRQVKQAISSSRSTRDNFT